MTRPTPWGAWETIALLLYLAAVGFGIAQHVPWADESQAWMLAQEVSLPILLTHSLHYEGTPGLWHCLLKLLRLLHLSFTGARWVAGGIAGAGVAVLLRYAPFPRIVRLLLPFSFFLAYQDAVIARSYVLLAAFAFAAAAMLRSARPRPLGLALVLGLMANISLHGLLASGGLALVAVIAWRSRSKHLHAVASLLLLSGFWALAIMSMAPARDVDFSAGNNVWRGLAKIENQLGVQAAAPPDINSLPMAGLPRAPLPVHLREGRRKAWNKLARTLSVVTYPLSSDRWLALLLTGLVIAQASLSRPGKGRPPGSAFGPLGLAPYLIMAVAFTSLYLEPRHSGMVFVVFVVAAWLTWPAYRQRGSLLLLERATAVVFTLVIVLQIAWTVHALASEHTLAYSPDKATADYLKQRGVGQQTLRAGTGQGKQVAGFYYYSAGPLLYFDHNLYINQPAHRYWSWSTQMRSFMSVEEVLAQHPALIVVGGYQLGPEAEISRDWLPGRPAEPGVRLGDAYFVSDYFRRHGYHQAQLFCGYSWMRSSYAEQVCESILEADRKG